MGLSAAAGIAVPPPDGADGMLRVPPEASKRKREGVVYSPEGVTRFLVERTIALTLDERRAALWDAHGMWEANAGGPAPEPERETAFQLAVLAALRDFTIVDPACGLGYFLVAAFDELARRYRDAVGRLNALGIAIDCDVFDAIITRNLYGVDLDPDSVEITRLALWLETGRRDPRPQTLEATIRAGNSLIEDAAFTDRPFDWHAAFPQVFARGGFDVVIGNPPYVRMEYLKPVKPYLKAHYVVAADRADLYAYFFEKGVQLVKRGGRLGYISSSTFFRTGSGEKLRRFLTERSGIESVVDFGELQVFRNVTTYPAILTLKIGDKGRAGELSFLIVEDRAPEDLGRAFVKGARPMLRARLGTGIWRFEDEALARLRDKIATQRKTLGEVYGPPMRGIVTGLNRAFVIDRPTRDRLVAADPNSAECSKPFLRGENVKRWRVESDDLFLVNTPKGKVDIERYPAIREWLLPFKQELEQRATRQQWWELQQAQLAYQPKWDAPKIVWPHFQDEIAFSVEREGRYLNNKCFFLPFDDWPLLAFLNSKCSRFQLFGLARPKRGGYIEAEAQYVAKVFLPDISSAGFGSLGRPAQICTEAARKRFALQSAVRHRILDLAPSERKKLIGRLEDWHKLDFVAFREEVKKAFRSDIPVDERMDWEAYLADNAAEVRRLTDEIATAEREIDAIVYDLFDLTLEEITLLETSFDVEC